MHCSRLPALPCVLVALAVVALVESGCGFVLGFLDEPPDERRPPDSGPPVGGHDVIDWDGDASLDPSDDAGLDAGRGDAGGVLDGGAPEAGPDGGLDAGVDAGGAGEDAGADDAGLAPDGGPLDAHDLDGGEDLPDASPLGDAGVDDAGPPPVPTLCGTVSNLRDDFDVAPPEDWVLESNGDVLVTQAEGGVRFEVPVGSTNAQGHGRLIGRWVTALSGDFIDLSFSQLPKSKRLSTVLSLFGPNGADEFLRLRWDGTAYYASVKSGSEGVDETTTHTSETAYKHWRVRQMTNGRVRFLVSTTGSGDWIPVATYDAPAWIDHVRPVLRVEGRAPNNQQVVVVDGVRGGIASPSWCGLGGLHEDFDDGAGPGWLLAPLEGCVSPTAGGSVSLGATRPDGLHCAVRTAAPRALPGEAVIVKLSDRPSHAFANTFAGLRLVGHTHEAFFGVRGGTLRATVQQLDGSDPISAQTQPAAPTPVYLRVAFTPNGPTFSYSGDGLVFTPLYQPETTALGDEAEVRLTLMSLGPEPGNDDTNMVERPVATFEGVNAE